VYRNSGKEEVSPRMVDGNRRKGRDRPRGRFSFYGETFFPLDLSGWVLEFLKKIPW
jgi:hypothetical protein